MPLLERPNLQRCQSLLRTIQESLSRHWLLILAVLVAWFVRDAFRVGLMGGNPQDDCIYVNLARAVANGQPLFARVAHVPDDFIANPSDWFNFRITYVYPTGLLFYLFGEGDRTATLVPMLASLSIVFTAYWITCLVANRTAGIFAAWLLALFPLDILTSTRVLTDENFAAFTMLAILCVLLGEKKRSSFWWFVGGLCIGLAYLTKILALPLAGAFSPVFILIAYRRKRLQWLFSCAAGIILVVGLEMLCYHAVSGRYLLHSFIVHSAAHFKNTTEPWNYTPFLPGLHTSCEGNFDFYYKPLFCFLKDGPLALSAIGLHAYLWLAGLAYVCWRRRWEALVAVYGFILIYLILEVVPIYVVHAEDHYNMIFFCRQLRYLVSLAPFGAILAGLLLASLHRRSRTLAILLSMGVLASAWPSLLHDYRAMHGSLSDIRQAARIASLTTDMIYVDRPGSFLMDYYMGGNNSARFVQVETLCAPKEFLHGLVVLGGSRGPELNTDVVTEGLPEWLKPVEANGNPPWPTWHPMMLLEGPHSEVRRFDMRLYTVSAPLSLREDE